jgi:hypothetical protein
MRRRRTVYPVLLVVNVDLRSSIKRTQNPAKAAGVARQGLDRGWGLLGFWRFVVGE